MKRLYTDSGFTLIELMIVVIIIAALAGMVIPRLIPASSSAQKKIAQGEIANIALSLDLYRLDTGKYPSTAEGLSALLQKPADRDEPYLEEITDPWNRKFEYAYPGTHNATKYDIWSNGAKTDSSDDDVTNWGTTETQ